MNGKFLLQGANIKTGKVLVLSCTNTLSWNLSNFLLNRDESVNPPLSDLELKMVAERKAGRDNRGGRASKEWCKRRCVVWWCFSWTEFGVVCAVINWYFWEFSFPAQHENILSLFSNCNVLCVVIFVAFWGTFLCSCYISLLVSVTAFATHQPF